MMTSCLLISPRSMTIQFLNMLKGLFMGGVVLVNFDNNVTIQLPDRLCNCRETDT
jgi:hypothetical protein